MKQVVLLTSLYNENGVLVKDRVVLTPVVLQGETLSDERSGVFDPTEPYLSCTVEKCKEVVVEQHCGIDIVDLRRR